MLDVAVFCHKLGPFGQTSLGNGDFFQQIADADAYAQVRVCFRKLVDIVPLGRVIDHIEKRRKARLFGITQQKAGGTLYQFIIDALVHIARRADRQQHGLCARTKARLDDLVEFQPGITGPAGDLIGHAQADVKTVRLFCGKRQRLCARVAVRNVDVCAPFLAQLAQLWVLVEHLIIGIVAQPRLLQLRRGKVDAPAVLTIQKTAIGCNGSGQQRLAVFSGDDDDDLTKLAVICVIHHTEQHRQKRFLP